MFLELCKKCRSYRRFDYEKKVTREQLVSFIECARFTASAGNMQKLRFLPVCDGEVCDGILANIKFAAYLKDWGGPKKEERPVAYIVICSESEISTNLAIDLGISAEAIALAAAEVGVGCCMFRSFSKEGLEGILNLGGMAPHLVIAFGYPSETVLVEDAENGDIKYYRDDNDVHIVPKLPLSELIIDKDC